MFDYVQIETNPSPVHEPLLKEANIGSQREQWQKTLGPYQERYHMNSDIKHELPYSD